MGRQELWKATACLCWEAFVLDAKLLGLLVLEHRVRHSTKRAEVDVTGQPWPLTTAPLPEGSGDLIER